MAVFSPPYPNAFDYHLYHRFRLFWLGHDPRELKHAEIGVHLRYLEADVWERDMQETLAQVAFRLRSGAYCVVIVGDGLMKGKTVPSGDILWRLAPAVGLEPVWRDVRTLATSRRAFNLADTRLRVEHVLAFRR